MLPQLAMPNDFPPSPHKKCDEFGGELNVLIASYEDYCGLVDEIERLTGGYFTFIFKISSPELSNAKTDAMETLAHILLFFQAHRQLVNSNDKLPEIVETLQADIVGANENIYLTVGFFRRMQRELLSVVQILCKNSAHNMDLKSTP